MDLLKDKKVVVTGGGSGIGLAITRAFVGEGAKVGIVGRNLDKLQEAARSLEKLEQVQTYEADIADPAQVENLFQQIDKHLGGVDILVNNAGVNIKERKFRQLTPQTWQQLMRTNLDGAFYCIHAAFPRMLKKKQGMIININSLAGKRASPLGGLAYAASKFGMTALGLGLGAEEKDSGIRVCSIYPGEVDTPILEHRPDEVTDEHRRRILKPEDIAAAALFVATLPPHVVVPELLIKPVSQGYL